MRARGHAALIAVGVMMLAGCGGGEEDQRAEAEASAAAEASASAAAEAEREAEEQAERDRKEAAARQRQKKCATSTEGLMTSLEEIDSRLNIGLNFDEYGDRVGDAQVAYDRLFAGDDVDLNMSCLRRVAIPLEGALNDYIDVLNVWNDCIADLGCNFNEGEPNRKAQAGWQKASAKLDKARAGLERLGDVTT